MKAFEQRECSAICAGSPLWKDPWPSEALYQSLTGPPVSIHWQVLPLHSVPGCNGSMNQTELNCNFNWSLIMRYPLVHFAVVFSCISLALTVLSPWRVVALSLWLLFPFVPHSQFAVAQFITAANCFPGCLLFKAQYLFIFFSIIALAEQFIF